MSPNLFKMSKLCIAVNHSIIYKSTVLTHKTHFCIIFKWVLLVL
uniref:Uncharacterized protein n=1 Tax=Anguilla anguilla TaxID=7936 RepID=A0A0E9TB60_ANGAN